MKIGSIMMCVGVVLIVLTTILGAWIGKQQEFLYAPAHGHLSLIGNLLFLFGLYYKVVPGDVGASMVAKIQGWLHIVGAIVFPAGLAAVVVIGEAYVPIMLIGAVCFLISTILFAFVVFKTSNA